MEELMSRIAKLEANKSRTPMQESVLAKLKKDLENSVSLGNTQAQTSKSMFFNKSDNLKVEKIATKNILPNPWQPRRHFRETEIADLAASIKGEGLITPIAVTKRDDKITLIAGQKRLKAYMYLNKEEEDRGLELIEMQYLQIPCYILDVEKDADIATLSIAENMARENPFVLDTANALKKLFELRRAEDPKLSQNKFSEMAKEELGIKSKGTISKYLQIAELDEQVQEELFKKGTDSFTELYELARSTLSKEEQISLIAQNALSNLAADKRETKQKKDEQEAVDGDFEEQGGAEHEAEAEKNKVVSKKPKSKIDIRYLVDTIKNLAATPIEDKARLEEELLEYLSEFSD